MRQFSLAVCAAAMSISAPAMATDPFSKMLAGESAMQGKKLEKAIEAASQYPLGSKNNPVRAHMPPGQQAYLSKLRCEDGTPVQFRRRGNIGPGPYRNIVDEYQVRCGSDNSTIASIYMDMYHKGYVETRPVPGYFMSPPAPPEQPEEAPDLESLPEEAAPVKKEKPSPANAS